MPRVQLQNDSKVKLYNPLTNTHRRQAVLLRQVRLQGRTQGTPSAPRACSHGRTAVPLRQVRVSYVGPPRLLTHHHCFTIHDCLHTTIASRSMTKFLLARFCALSHNHSRSHTHHHNPDRPNDPKVLNSPSRSLPHTRTLTHAHRLLARARSTLAQPPHNPSVTLHEPSPTWRLTRGSTLAQNRSSVRVATTLLHEGHT